MSAVQVPTLSLQSSPLGTRTIERAVLEALTYSDIFEHPLRLEELHRYLPVPATVEDLRVALESLHHHVRRLEGVYFLAGRDEIVEVRRQREARSRSLFPYAIRYGRILGTLPFIRMTALTGSLAVLNVSKAADFDYMLVTAKGRVWTARAFALLFNRLVRPFGHTICPNLIVSETALEWPMHDLYSARELCQMIPITGMDVYQQLIRANDWTRGLLPNAFDVPGGSETRPHDGQTSYPKGRSLRNLLVEFPFIGALGESFERWEMTRKVARFSKQAGFGEETIFTAEICQGNFHHHRKWTREVFEEKLAALEFPLPWGEG
jgi:hypothetical protein